MEDFEFGSILKSLRAQRGMSQEELADAVYVTRQTISNWETAKSYPDIKSLLILSNFFSVSVDYLVKGDLKKMKEIDQKDVKKLSKLSGLLTVMDVLVLLAPIPLAKYLGWWGMAVYIVIAASAIAVALAVEKLKKSNNIGTFKELDAFFAGKRLDEIECVKEEAKRPYQKILGAIIGAAIALLVSGVMFWIFK